MAPKLRNRDYVSIEDPNPSNQEASISRSHGRGRGRGRGQGRGKGRDRYRGRGGRGGRGSQGYEEAPSSSYASMRGLGDDLLLKLPKLHRWINLPDSFARFMEDYKPLG